MRLPWDYSERGYILKQAFYFDRPNDMMMGLINQDITSKMQEDETTFLNCICRTLEKQSAVMIHQLILSYVEEQHDPKTGRWAKETVKFIGFKYGFKPNRVITKPVDENEQKVLML